MTGPAQQALFFYAADPAEAEMPPGITVKKQADKRRQLIYDTEEGNAFWQSKIEPAAAAGFGTKERR